MEPNILTGSFQLMKSLNRSVILNTIRKKGGISRADIAKTTKLTPPTVSNLVKELLETEMIIETSLGVSSGGRKPTLLTLNSDMFHVIGLDIGSHHLKIILTDINGRIRKKQIHPIPDSITNEGLLDLMITSIYAIQKNEQIDRNKIIGIGIGMHGIVDVDQGVSVFAPNLKLKNIGIKDALEKEFQMVVQIENDARAMSLGELWFGNGHGDDSIVCINVGRGIGAGIIINGQVFRGEHYISGEIGHMAIDLNGPKCTCGNYGCLQTFASGPAIVESLKKELKLGESSILSNKENEIDGEVIYQAALAGDLLSKNILNKAGRYLGVGVTNLIHTVNPKRIVISGGVSNAKEFILESVKKTIEQRALTDSAKQTEVIISKFGADATVMGAIALILAQLFATPGNT
ncbi:ROK family transcriptional regulator [Peribacillus huizhouensis]|uniref:Glucokinase-like ROK family protein n=1 Tax=Peribacillus huizhouensis TaxID=1501239 RepID=A0ABR6CUS8_9BACI|nr:ROK family transcriptional regulator [Peribacillus huizhouensis]MBA9028715.1 glucokinase-like ROK family protein [Peribacillus huizhouensis]